MPYERKTTELWFDAVEMDLMTCALQHWKQRLTEVETNVTAQSHVCAKHFTVRCIDALLARLQQPNGAGGNDAR